MAGIYIHIPFCRKACHYCNFHFSTSHHRIPSMVDAIGKEIILQKNYLKESVQTIYFGGGTPSLLSAKELNLLMSGIRSNFAVEADAEITLEANPDDICSEKLEAWKSSGINRLSIGVQSFFDQDLAWMNRAHRADQAKEAILLSKEAGFSNITIDLIYGTPTLTDAMWKSNVATAIAMGIDHLSCYALTVEPKTGLEKMIEKKQIDPVHPDKQARHFILLMEWLQDAGFEHYEISNFARPGARSKHNSNYWTGASYLGLGPSAHSFDGNNRQWNVANNSLYLQSLDINTVPFEEEILSPQHRLNEYIMTSIRTMEGLSLNKVSEQWGKESRDTIEQIANKPIAASWMMKQNDHLILTNEGKLMADGIAADLFFV